jgi:hypothetical protein
VIPKVAEGVNLAVDAATVEGVGDLRGWRNRLGAAIFPIISSW